MIMISNQLQHSKTQIYTSSLIHSYL